MGHKYLHSSTQRKSFAYVLCVLCLFYPYMFPDLFLPFLDSSMKFYMVVAGLTLLLNFSSPQHKSMPLEFWIPVIVMLLGSVIAFIYTGSSYCLIRCLMLFTSCNLIYFVHSRIGLFSFYGAYNRWIYIMAIGGVIGLVLALIGIPPIIKTIAMNDDRPFYSWLFTCTKPVSETRFIRYSGFFDEPGAMAYWGVFAIAINKLFIKDRKIEWPLIILLLFSFSAGYYVQLVVYICFFALKGTSLFRKIAILSLFAFLLGAAYFSKGTMYNEMYEKTFGRFENVTVGEDEDIMTGTNRNFMAAKAFMIWQENPVWGMSGRDKTKDNEYFLDNPYETLATDGIVGFIYINFPFWWLIIMAIRKKDYDLLGVTLFCALSLIHRPVHANMLTYFILYSIPCMYGLKIREKKSQYVLKNKD